MLIWLIPLVTFALGVGIVAWFAARYWNRVAILDVQSDPQREKRAKKTALFMDRLERMTGEKVKGASASVDRIARSSKGLVKRLYSRAQAMERHYKRLQKESTGQVGTNEMRAHLREEAEALIEKESYAAAEQRLIELLSLDPKNAKVYELLGSVYESMKQYDQARQTYEYARVLSPQDASILTSLGEVALRDGQTAQAVDYFDQAVSISPHNPKYLDYLVDSSILAGDRRRAIRGLKLLKTANPENKKIEEFEQRIRDLPLV